MNITHLPKAPVLAIGVVAALVACSTGRAGVAGEPPLGSRLHGDDLRELRLPLDAYRPDPASARLLNRAQAAAFIDCMRRFGLEPHLPQSTQLVPNPNEQRYGLTDSRQATAHGYHQAPPQGATRQRAGGQLSSAEQAVADGTASGVVGVPKGGCLAEAQRALGAGAPTSSHEGLLDRLNFDSFNRSQRDSRTRRALDQWAACMHRAGYNYPDPMAANNDRRFRTAEPSLIELATARADVECKRRTDLVSIWATVETAYQRRMVLDHAAELRSIRRVLDTEIQNAQRLNGQADSAAEGRR